MEENKQNEQMQNMQMNSQEQTPMMNSNQEAMVNQPQTPNVQTEFEKVQKYVKNDLIIIAVLQALVFGLSFVTPTVETNIFNAIYAVLLYWGHLEAKKGNKSAGVIGIVFGILMSLTLLSFDIIDGLLGIFLIIHSSKYLKHLKK